MSSVPATRDLFLQPADNIRLIELCGPLDGHLRQIESRLGVEVKRRGNRFQIVGAPEAARRAETVLQDLYARGDREPVDSERVHLALQELNLEADAGAVPAVTGLDVTDELKVRTARGAVRARGANQTEYLQNVHTHDLTFGIGPAGTGKTYLAVACAVEALQMERVRRIILVRPAVEAGERLGFLPGDLSQKVDPYLRPMYDALYEMLGFERVAKLIERNVIEVAPLAFMRGRSLNDSFVILDEAQNTTSEQMKMFLTRIGFGSKAVVTGDITQVDLPNARQSGLRTVISILRGVRGIAFTMFTSRDVVRHPWYSASCRPTRRIRRIRPRSATARAAAGSRAAHGIFFNSPPVPFREQIARATCIIPAVAVYVTVHKKNKSTEACTPLESRQ